MVQAAPQELAKGKDGSEKDAIELVSGSFGAKRKQQRVVVLINTVISAPQRR